ncbi:MAG: tetratricopeptide repeat protein [Thermodesulfobacteriota bacterium]|nr:tetratricopeptide repeat protein [Thermodesulfobacteriota bacterium]
MSYIHEALKKAQKERDSRYQEYGGSLVVQRVTPGLVTRKAMILIFILLILILFAFVAYSWLDSRSPQTRTKPEYGQKEHVAAQQLKSVADAERFYGKARSLHEKGDLQDAGRLYRETLRIDPGHTEALNNLGVIYICEKEYVAARDSFEKAIRLKPGNVDPCYNLACLYALEGKTGQSLAFLKKAVSLDRSVIDWARRDTDLKSLAGVPDFEALLKGGETR